MPKNSIKYAPRIRWTEAAGRVFGPYTIIAFVRVEGRRYCDCRCVCGQLVRVRIDHIKAATDCPGHYHGQTGSREHRIWKNMLGRCRNLKDQYYGGRGIRVCERWQSFVNFLADMGPAPTDKHSIDRFPDMNGNYEPGNCRWATKAEQSSNTRQVKLITFDGQTRSRSEWAKHLGISTAALSSRLKSKMPRDEALTLPKLRRVRPRRNKKNSKKHPVAAAIHSVSGHPLDVINDCKSVIVSSNLTGACLDTSSETG